MFPLNGFVYKSWFARCQPAQKLVDEAFMLDWYRGGPIFPWRENRAGRRWPFARVAPCRYRAGFSALAASVSTDFRRAPTR